MKKQLRRQCTTAISKSQGCLELPIEPKSAHILSTRIEDCQYSDVEMHLPQRTMRFDGHGRHLNFDNLRELAYTVLSIEKPNQSTNSKTNYENENEANNNH